MRMALSQQAEEIVGKSALVSITERVDEVALRIGQRVTMGLPEVVDQQSPRHGTQRGRSWGWTATRWLASIVTAGEHRQGSVETSSTGMTQPLRQLSAQGIAPADLSDDRLRHLRQPVRKPPCGPKIERALTARSRAVYAWAHEVSRCDAPPVSGEHEVTADGLGQCGQRKDDPTRPQITVLMGSLAPVGMPLGTEVWSGERADDGFDIPRRERLRTGVTTSGLLWVGDWEMRALDTRAHSAGHHAWYVSPWPLTGATAEALDAWSAEGRTQGEAGELARRVRPNERGHEGLVAEGFTTGHFYKSLCNE